MLRHHNQLSAAAAAHATFLNLPTNSDSSSNHHCPSQSILQSNVQASNDSMIAAAISHESADFNNSNNDNSKNGNNVLIQSGCSGGVSGGEGVLNWQNARQKAGILSHPLCEQLLSAHVACLRIATPVDQLPRIDVQLAQSQQVFAKYADLGHGNLGGD